PTRVLDLGYEGQTPLKADICLYETRNERARYLTLSHCWGTSQHIVTKKDNLQLFKNGIAWKNIPNTYRDAIIFARSLGERYLWIDSLCIIQDDNEDWLRESAKMGQVYQQSYLTIAATSAPDGAAGMYASQTEKRRPEHRGFDESGHDMAPLLTRAWVYQERVLSSRVIHFCSGELVWECNQLFACECGDVERDESQRATQSPKLRRDRFRASIIEYGKLNLTYATDRLPAIGGIARQYSWFARGRYLTGLWEDTIVKDLQWRVKSPSKPLSYVLEGLEILKEGPEETKVFVAPSWSWAA
ncbi:HET-domain-containing protein, partial [Lepidopterella palustris CBS 459.81]